MVIFLAVLCFLFILQAESFLASTNAGTCCWTKKLSTPCRGLLCTPHVKRPFALTTPKLYNSVNYGKDIAAWDMFGRVPYDDWLFTTARLADPSILKRSFVEAVSQELPIALSSHQRRKGFEGMISSTLFMIPLTYFLVRFCKLAIALGEVESVQRAREDAVRGFKSAIGVYRKLTGGEDESEGTGRGRSSSRKRHSPLGSDGDDNGDDDDDEPFRRLYESRE